MAVWSVPGAVDSLPPSLKIAALVDKIGHKPMTIPPNGGVLFIEDEPAGAAPTLADLSPEDAAMYGHMFAGQ